MAWYSPRQKGWASGRRDVFNEKLSLLRYLRDKNIVEPKLYIILSGEVMNLRAGILNQTCGRSTRPVLLGR